MNSLGSQRAIRVTEFFSWTTAILPILVVASLIVAGTYVRARLGHWPVVYQDSTSFPFKPFALFSGLIAVLAPLPLLLLALVAAVARWQAGARPVIGRWLLTFAVGFLALLACLWLTPFGGFVGWVLD